MAETPNNAWFFYQGWDTYQGLLIKMLTPLTPEQLTLRSAANLRSVGENSLHIIGARARWERLVLGIGDEAIAALGEWDRKGMPQRDAAELVSGLQQSWQVLHDALHQWTPADLSLTHPNTDQEPGEPDTFTRQWVIWHLVEHDVHHGGEISQILGAHGIPGLDL